MLESGVVLWQGVFVVVLHHPVHVWIHFGCAIILTFSKLVPPFDCIRFSLLIPRHYPKIKQKTNKNLTITITKQSLSLEAYFQQQQKNMVRD
jgi:hypothetical protein